MTPSKLSIRTLSPMRMLRSARMTNPLSLLQNPKSELIYFAKRYKKRGAGGHFWHDGVNQNDTVTPAP
jgi:hypothetical protein